MPQIVQQGSLNTTALVVPDLYVQIVPPQNMLINGVPTNVIGVVGTAQWGPKNQPMIVGSMAQYAQIFGAIQNRGFDMGTVVAAAVLQGAQNFRCVRVTDGTDAAATVVVQSTCVTFNALYTGSLGNSATVTIGAGSRVGTSKVSVGIPGFLSEVFDNIGAGPQTTSTALVTSSVTIPVASTVGLSVGMNVYGTGVNGSPTIATIPTGNSITVSVSQTSIPSGTTLTFALAANALWVAMAAAINSGNSVTRGPSNIVTATAGVGTAVPTLAAYLLTGGNDGVTTLTASVSIGLDTTPRTGMYALRGQGCSVAVICTADDTTPANNSGSWTTQAAFGLSEGVYMICATPAGDTITNAVAVKAAAGLDTYAVKLLMGDWIYWQDPVNQVLRLISPQGFAAGRLGNLSPEQSPLNKALYGIVGTQKSGLVAAQNTTYATAELQVLGQAGIDVISNPQPAGNIWGCRFGHNSSSNSSIHGDNYTRMTNYIASTLAAGMGQYVGQVINNTMFRKVRATLMNFFANMLYAGQLGSTDGSLPFGVICDISNNPLSLTGLGYLTANVQVQYQAINEFFIVNLEGGQTVQVLKQAPVVSNAPTVPAL